MNNLKFIRGKRANNKKTKQAKKNNEESNEAKSDEESDDNDVDMTEETPENLEIDKLKLKEESVFEITVNKDKQSTIDEAVVITKNETDPLPFTPLPRRSAYLQLHKGYLYLYGGCFEGKNGKEITLSDLNCLNLKKLDEWKTLIEDKSFKSSDQNALKKMEEIG